MHDRHHRVESLLHHIAAEFVQQQANTNPLITITRVSISPDYRKATLFFTTLPAGKELEAEIFLKRYAGELRQYIKKHSDLKIVPHVEVMLDVGERHRQHIDALSREIENPDKQ